MLSPPAVTGGRNRGIGFVSHGGSIAASYFKHQTSRFKPPTRLPLPMLRVARIVTEFCARARPETPATPCAPRDKEFLARGVFCLFNCCTNGTRERQSPDWLYEKHGELLSHHGGTACPRGGGGRTRRKSSTLEPQISPIGADFLPSRKKRKKAKETCSPALSFPRRRESSFLSAGVEGSPPGPVGLPNAILSRLGSQPERRGGPGTGGDVVSISRRLLLYTCLWPKALNPRGLGTASPEAHK